MRFCKSLRLIASAMLAAVLLGCSSSAEWEVAVENRSNAPCSVYVTMRADGSSQAGVSNLASGKTRKLIVGNGDTIVKTVKVVRDGEEQEFAQDAKLLVGQRLAIVVGKDGDFAATVEEK